MQRVYRTRLGARTTRGPLAQMTQSLRNATGTMPSRATQDGTRVIVTISVDKPTRRCRCSMYQAYKAEYYKQE